MTHEIKQTDKTVLFAAVGLTPEQVRDSSFEPFCRSQLPPGEWELIGLCPGLTEEQAQRVVERAYESSEGWRWKDYTNNDGYSGSTKTALESLATLMQRERLYTVNPYWHPGTEKPIGEVEVSYDRGLTWDDHTEWREERRCMMAGYAGGHGYFGEGWATSKNSPGDKGLICDPPDYWRYIEDLDKEQEAQARTSACWAVLVRKN